MKAAGLQAYIKKFKDGKILVVGDLILDQYIWGRYAGFPPRLLCRS